MKGIKYRENFFSFLGFQNNSESYYLKLTAPTCVVQTQLLGWSTSLTFMVNCPSHCILSIKKLFAESTFFKLFFSL